MNGTYIVTADSTTATLDQFVVITTEERKEGAFSSGSETYDWTAHFVATPPRSIDLSIPPPPGSLTVEGVTVWTSDEASFTLDISTPETLAFDAACEDGPEFFPGRIRALLRSGRGASIDIRYLGCAVQPQITLVAGT
jgi:hypothetical protein